MTGRKKFGEENLFEPLEMGAWREVMSQLVVFYRTGNETVRMDLEEKRKR
jgi:hypothetical protein